MPFCRECGNEIDGAMKFCPHCAAPQEVSPSTQSTSSSPPPAQIEDEIWQEKNGPSPWETIWEILNLGATKFLLTLFVIFVIFQK